MDAILDDIKISDVSAFLFDSFTSLIVAMTSSFSPFRACQAFFLVFLCVC